jgi:foldase protein PrsA
MLRNKNKPIYKHKWILAFTVLMLVLAMLSGCGKKDAAAVAADGKTAGKPTDVIATYKENGKVTRAEFDTFLNLNKFLNPQLAQFADDPAFQQDLLKQLIGMRVLASRADDKAKAEADKKVKDQLEQFKTYFGKMEGGLDKQLKDAKIELKDVESFLQMSAYGITGLKNKITDDEVKAEYDKKLKDNPHAYDVATVSHILIGLKDAATQKDLRTKDEALARAKEVKAKLDQGGDFAALAKEYSDDPGSKDNGGTYKDADINQWVEGFKKAAAELPIGKISDPVETEYGYHIMKVESRKTKTFDEVKDSLREEMAQTKAYDFMDKELPGLILTNTLPQPKPADNKGTGTGTGTPNAGSKAEEKK